MAGRTDGWRAEAGLDGIGSREDGWLGGRNMIWAEAGLIVIAIPVYSSNRYRICDSEKGGWIRTLLYIGAGCIRPTFQPVTRQS